MSLSGSGDGGSMILILLQAFIDVLDFLWRSVAEADRLHRVVLAGLGGHGCQSHGGAKMHTMDGDFIDAAFNRIKARFGVFSLGVYLVGDSVRRRLQTIDLCRQGYIKWD